MAKGVKYSKAYKMAANTQQKERNKSAKVKRLKDLPKKEIIKAIHKKILKKYKKIRIWIINGELVRSLLYLDYGEGGHDIVYKFIPKNEIWIEDDMPSKERNFIILHELHERNWMLKGYKYIPAHKKATKIEDFARHNPSKLKKLIEEELKKI